MKAATLLCFCATVGFAQSAPPAAAPAAVPYSHPWQRRPAAVATTLRLDASAGFWRNGEPSSGHTEVIGLIASRRLSSRAALLGRLSFIDNNPPSLSGERPGSAFGPRFHFKLGGGKWIRPGLSLTVPLDERLSGQRYPIVQFDVPVSF